MLRRFHRQPDHDAMSWSLLVLLLIVVLVPTVGVLWFMTQAMGNERLAVRQKLHDVYQAQLLTVQREVERHWQSKASRLALQVEETSAAGIFADRVRAHLADSVIVFDTNGRPAYPATAGNVAAGNVAAGSVAAGSVAAGSFPPPAGWRRAERLEHSGQSAAAAASYGAIAAEASDPNLEALALQAQARCLAQANRTAQALEILVDRLASPRYEEAVDRQGRLIAPNARLRALQLIADGSDPRFQTVFQELSRRLSDYGPSSLAAAQRLFLMRQLSTTLGESVVQLATEPSFDTLAAERLAARYVDSNPPAAVVSALQPSGLADLWHWASSDGRVVALFDQPRLIEELRGVIALQSLPRDTTVDIYPPTTQAEDPFAIAVPAGLPLQGWQLVLIPQDPTLLATAARQRISAYLSTGVLVVGLLVFLVFLVARTVGRQLRLTQLKNNLLSTVSHELKTPLASMRLLVDTLLETGTDDSVRSREYLQLIAQENARLSRLVDNFLTFSRIDRKRQRFDRRLVEPATVIEGAVAAIDERWRSADCHLEVHLEPDLPPIEVDTDAMVTVLLNLLDNAFKYSEGDKHILLRAHLDEGKLCLSVRDHGIGMSRQQAARIFDRFYQVDASLSRDGGGCGLGLSIVKLIVDAHGGAVTVDSRPGMGSTFTVRLPTAGEGIDPPQEDTP